MEQSYIEKNQEAAPEIHTIPDEFYGEVKQKPAPSLLAVSQPAPSVFPKKTILPTFHFFQSPKFILFGSIIVFILIVAGFAFYYIRQAQKVKQKLATPAPASQPAAPLSTPEVPVVAPTSTPAEIVEETATTTPSPLPPFSVIFPFKNYTAAADSDNDGLTDEEEKNYGTDPARPDSDSDGYLDSLEVENLYNPLGFKPVRLLDSGKVKVYLNPTFNYSIFYPENWLVQALDANNQDVLFTSETGEFIEVLVEDNPLGRTVADWYLGQAPGVEVSQLEKIITKEKSGGVKSPDGLVAYLPYNGKIFVVNYNIGLKTEVNFLKTFQMMVQSFRPAGNLEDLPFGIATSTATSTD